MLHGTGIGISGLIPRYTKADNVVRVLAGLSVHIVLRKVQATPEEI